MPAEFDFSRSIPNPWFVAVHGPEYVRVIDKDLAALFPDDESMNASLRSIAQAAARGPRNVSARTAAPKPKKRAPA
jgi:hypothetical protein